MEATTNKTALFLALAISLGAFAADLETHRKFLLEGIYDSTLPDEVAYDIVREGIESNNPEITYLTVAALSVANTYQRFAEFGMVDWALSVAGRGMPPQRDFSRVPGIKDFLIAYWRDQHARSGYAADYDASVERRDMKSELTQPGREVWKATPSLLCRYFPGDSEVQDLLWEILETERATAPYSLRSMMLDWLNGGRFMTPEADAYRVRVIEAETEWEIAHAHASSAVKGLALSRRPEALPTIIGAAQRYRLAEPEVFAALALYPDDQLMPHVEEIKALVSRGETYHEEFGKEATIRAMSRLRALWNPDSYAQ